PEYGKKNKKNKKAKNAKKNKKKDTKDKEKKQVETATASDATPSDASSEAENNDDVQETAPVKTYIGSYELTAYIATGNPCASGVYPTVEHTVACNSLPMGTRIYIEGYGEFVVEDTGGMADNVIDIFVSDYDTAIEFGRRIADVYVIE
ncbi:MAG: 3D domain-containing protein, partial [Eubacterium sp.]|nr:3D domain-containing protein [Eubacterium sp.]